MTYDVLAAPIIAAVVVSPSAARRLRKAGVWTWAMGWGVGIASVFAGRKR